MTTAVIPRRSATRTVRASLAIAANVAVVAGAALMGLGLIVPGLVLIVAFPVLAALALGTARRHLMHLQGEAHWQQSVHWPALLAAAGVSSAIAILILVVDWPVGYAETAGAVLFFSALYLMYETEIGREAAAPEAADSRSAIQSLGLSQTEYDTLRDSDMLRALDAAQLREVLSLGTRRRVPEGRSLGEAGHLGDKVYIVLSSQAQLAANTGFGPMTVRIAGPGESFPLASLVGYGMLITSVRAMRDMDAFEMGRQELLDLCQRRPEIGARIFAAAAGVMATRYRDTLKRLTAAADQSIAGAESSVQV